MVAKYRVKKWGQWKSHTIRVGQELSPADLEKLATPEVRAIWFRGREPAIVGLDAERGEVLLDAQGQPRPRLTAPAPPPVPEPGPASEPEAPASEPEAPPASE